MITPFDPAAARADILARIAKAAQAAGRAPESITLVAVSKQQDEARVEAVLAAGQMCSARTRCRRRKPAGRARRAGIALRLIGPLQSNKAEDAIALFDAIDSVDRPKLLQALAKAADKAGRCPELLIQINTGEEAQKAGVAPSEADALIAEARGLFGEKVRGLMCIPPADEPPGPHFALLAKIAARNGLETLSMGMSGDFETAIRFGATHVRVGMALFGPRDLT